MADNVQPDAGEEREASASGLLISTDPLQDSTGYSLSENRDRVPSADQEADDVDFDSDEDGGGDSDDSDGGGGLTVEVGGDTGDSDNGDSDNGDSDR